MISSVAALIGGFDLRQHQPIRRTLVYQLAAQAGERHTNRQAFPCVRRAEHWAGVRGNFLKGAPDHWAEEIRRVQPFEAGYAGDLDARPLAVLDDCNNRSKHGSCLPRSPGLLSCH
jgi:hypothetical protein